jgi:hypothetical protein
MLYHARDKRLHRPPKDEAGDEGQDAKRHGDEEEVPISPRRVRAALRRLPPHTATGPEPSARRSDHRQSFRCDSSLSVRFNAKLLEQLLRLGQQVGRLTSVRKHLLAAGHVEHSLAEFSPQGWELKKART